jgi:hypothetical protein
MMFHVSTTITKYFELSGMNLRTKSASPTHMARASHGLSENTLYAEYVANKIFNSCFIDRTS